MSDAIENIMKAGRDDDDEPTPPIALTIAGSDSGGGAGIQADLKTFAACEVHGTNVVTLVTAQNTRDVSGIQILPAETVQQQYAAVIKDLPPHAAKTGALGSAAMVKTVCQLLEDRPIAPLVVDPVMISKHGDPLMPEEGQEAIRSQLLEHATIATPNRHEAEALSGTTVGGPDTMKEAAKRIYDLGPDNVVVKGSHLDEIVRDYLYDGTGFVEYGADKIDSNRRHGSGCVFSAAITAQLAHGYDLTDAVGFAREFITRSIAQAPPLGSGFSPVHPLHNIWS